MEKFGKVIKFLLVNRRTLGLLLGASLTLAGLPEYADLVQRAGEL